LPGAGADEKDTVLSELMREMLEKCRFEKIGQDLSSKQAATALFEVNNGHGIKRRDSVQWGAICLTTKP